MESCLHRREFLGLAAGSVTLGAIGSMLGAAPAGAAAANTGSLEFAIVSDTHVNVSATERQQWLASVLTAIAARNPAFVLHCGDVTDTGVVDEYQLYDQLLPSALRGRVHYSPGNHEVRWDGSAEELYHGHFGPAPYVFEAAGIRFIGFDPTQQLQEPGHYSDAHLAWLDRQLYGDTPSFLFQHHPMGDDFYYVDDQDRFFDLVRRHPLRGILAGHIHADHVSRFNGQTQVAFNAVKNGPMYYWARLNAGAVEIARVDVAADGTQTTKPAATVPLTGAMAAPPPTVIDLGRVAGGALPVKVRLGAGETPVSVGALAYPQAVFSLSSKGTWLDLAAGADASWRGALDVTKLPVGSQRVKVRVTGSDGAWWEDVRGFEVPGNAGTPTVAWRQKLDGAVQGALAVVGGDTVIAGSTAGDVIAIDGSGHPQWTTKVGPVYRAAAVSTDQRTVYVPSTDHCLYALDARNGQRRWTFRASAPVLSWPLVADIGGVECVLVSAGNSLLALDARSGRQLWVADAGGFSAGRVACDGDRVYRGGGDGHLRAFDSRTGKQIWDRVLVAGDENHVLLYGPWDVALLLHAGTLVTSTVAGAWGIDPATGADRWTRTGGYMYPPAVPIPGDTAALLLTETGALSLVDLADGTSRWDTALTVRVLNSGGVLRGGTLWVQSVDGQLIGVNIADGAESARFQNGTAYCFATPVTVGKNVVVADQDGSVRGISVG